MSDSIIQRFTSHLRSSLIKAHDFAQEFGHEEITPAHLLYGLSAQRGSLSFEVLKKADFPVDLIKQDLVRKHYIPYTNDPIEARLNDDCITLLTKAISLAKQYEHSYVGTEHVLYCLLQWEETSFQELFKNWQVNLPELRRQVLVVLKSTSKFPDLSQTIRYIESNQEEPEEDSEDLPVLRSIAKELTDPEYVQSLSPLIGRDFQLTRAVQILGRKDKNNPLLVGKPGVGKTAIIEGLARSIGLQEAKGFLKNKRIFSLELGSLVAGTMYRGEFEQRMKSMLDEIKEHPEIILFIDEIHTLVGAGSTGQPLDAANILKPALARGEIRVIGATTWEEYQKHLKDDKALARRFQLITVEEPSKEETKAILSGVKETYQDFHGVKLTKESLEAALDLSERYLTHSAWPDKALDLLDEAASQVSLDRPPSAQEKKKEKLNEQLDTLQQKKKIYLAEDKFDKAFDVHKKTLKLMEELEELSTKTSRTQKITEKHIQEVVAQRTGLSLERFTQAGPQLSETLHASLQKDVLGQDKALKQIAESLNRSYSLLKEPEKPLASFLLLGPSGVGKTTTAKSLANHLFGSPQHLIKIDMSEYAERHSLSKLVGAPAGYVGYQQSGILTKAIEEQPLSVIVFDEVEKAHPDVFNLLLQILDDGTLRDGAGKQHDFRHALILLTSNLGLKDLSSQVGFTQQADSVSQIFTSSAKSFFQQEFLNRLDSIIIYEHLGKNEQEAIIKKKIIDLDKRIGNFAQLSISDEAIAHLTSSYYKKEEGVRSLHRAVKKEVESLLTQALQEKKKGDSIHIDLEQETIILS